MLKYGQWVSLYRTLWYKLYLGTSRKKKTRGFFIFPRNVKMGLEEIHPRVLFYDFEEVSPRNYFFEIWVPRGLFLFLEDPKPRDINTRFSSSFFSSRYHPRGINYSRWNFAPRESIILSEMTVNCWKIIYLIVKKNLTIKISKKNTNSRILI